jgi:hypothetical protein
MIFTRQLYMRTLLSGMRSYSEKPSGHMGGCLLVWMRRNAFILKHLSMLAQRYYTRELCTHCKSAAFTIVNTRVSTPQPWVMLPRFQQLLLLHSSSYWQLVL